MKKLKSIFLVLAMILTLAPMNIFAAEIESSSFSDMKATDYYFQAVKELEELGIISGYPNGTYGAEKTITRAEMAAIVCRIIDKEADAEKEIGETIFDDVAKDHWASGHINIAVAEGIINGDGNGKFRPEDDVKYEEAIKMIVCALGYADDIEADSEDWADAYLKVAKEKGITDNLKGKKGEAATRGDIAVMSHNGVAKENVKAEIPATPTASKKAGEYRGTQKVALTTTTENAVIYYTTDGSTPTEKSNKYKKEISISKTCTLKAIAVKDGVVSKEVMSVEYTIKRTSSGGGGSYTPPTISITVAELQVNNATVTSAKVGDVLTLVTTPAEATGTISWSVGGNKIAETGKTYTVKAFDMGKKIKVEITGNGSYKDTVTAECTVESTTQVTADDIMGNDVDSSPVVLTDVENTTFLDNEGNSVSVDAGSSITLSIEKPQKPQEEVSAAQTIIIEDIVANSSVEASNLTDVTTTAVDVNLSINDKAVHPVGDVTVTLSATQLGLSEDTDLTLHTFSASHKNKKGESEIVTGKVVTIDNVQYVRFELNGLSTIWIGNIPPRTVSFYNMEEDADNKVNSIGSVVVKFGDFTPTDKIPTPSRSGYLFCGWNYDMTRTPIITNLEVHANWVAGEKIPSENINVTFSESTEIFTVERENGFINIDSENKENLPKNLKAKVTVTPPEGAKKYFVGTNASVVAAFNDENGFLDATVSEGVGFDVVVTDENGVIVPSANTYYYKWLNAEGSIIAIQEIEAKVANGTDGAVSMKYTANVNRGIGTFELYMIDKEDATKDFVGYINNSLSGHALKGYVLNNYVSFDEYRIGNDLSRYDAFKLVFKPFEGESYSSSDVISATGEYYGENEWNDNWNGTYEISGDNLIVTYPFDDLVKKAGNGVVFVTVNGVEQAIDINWYLGTNLKNEDVNCATWDEVLSALQNVSNDKEYYIHCSDSSPITLSGSLTIPTNVGITFSDCPSFTVSNGATVTLKEDKDRKTVANIRLSNGDFIVENGGKITTAYDGNHTGTTFLAGISAKNIKLNSGANVTVTKNTGLSIRTSNYSKEEKGMFTLEKGATMTTDSSSLHVNNFDVVNLNGTISGTGYIYFHDDEINISGTANLEANRYYGRLELYGTVNVEESGLICVNNTATTNHNSTNLEIYGPLTNKGRIEIKGNFTGAEIMNNGFAIYNIGTISVGQSCTLNTSGTKYINTGLITGEGSLKATIGDDYTNYDDGTEYVKAENDGYWDQALGEWVYNISDYSRYKYTHDPAKTVETTLYLGEVENMGDGKCTISFDAEAFPQ